MPRAIVSSGSTIGSTIGQILSPAIGVAISPVPIIAAILMLFTPKAVANSVGFLIGWLTGLTAAGLIVLALDLQSSDGTASDTSGYIKIIIGVLFIALGVRQWRSRPKAGEEPSLPGWMSAIDEFTAIKSIGLGLLLSGANPKNLGLTIVAASTISASGLSDGEELVVLIVIVLLASLTIIVPVLANLILGEKAQPTLTSMKDWLAANNATVMTVLFVVIGAKVLGDGISIIA